MRRVSLASSALALLALASPPLGAQERRNPSQQEQGVPGSPAVPRYPVVAALVLAAPVIADATIRRAQQLKGTDATGVQPGAARFYIEADVAALLRGTGGLPPRVAYVVDLPPDARGRTPKLKKQRVLLFARTTGNPAQVQLVSAGAQRDWTPELDALVRRIAAEVVAPDAPPEVIGIGNAFHVPGALPGEGETQIFLKTRDGRPISLSVIRRAGERPRWAAAFSEIVDDSATVPTRDTLAWYRLACALPSQLPDAALVTAAGDDAALAREDYRFVLEQLGACRVEG